MINYYVKYQYFYDNMHTIFIRIINKMYCYSSSIINSLMAIENNMYTDLGT